MHRLLRTVCDRRTARLPGRCPLGLKAMKGLPMSESTSEPRVETGRVEASEFRKSLDSFEVPAPVVVEVPVMTMDSTPLPAPQAPTDYDG